MIMWIGINGMTEPILELGGIKNFYYICFMKLKAEHWVILWFTIITTLAILLS